MKYPHVIGGMGGTPRFEAPPMPGLSVCPADTEKMASKRAEMSYVGNAGREDSGATAAVPADWLANGIFLNLLPWRGDPATA